MEKGKGETSQDPLRSGLKKNGASGRDSDVGGITIGSLWKKKKKDKIKTTILLEQILNLMMFRPFQMKFLDGYS